MKQNDTQPAAQIDDRQETTISAADKFLDLLARLIAREHIRKSQSANAQTDENAK
jgi:hypothetical protein